MNKNVQILGSQGQNFGTKSKGLNDRSLVVSKSPEIDDRIYMTIGQIASD